MRAYAQLVTEKSWLAPTDVVPMLYGRRLVKPRLVERHTQKWGTVDQECSFLLIAAGPLSSVERVLVDGKEESDAVSGGVKRFGYFWREGRKGVETSSGVPDQETQAEYNADPTTVDRVQNVDYRCLGSVTFSGHSYAIFLKDLSSTFDDKQSPDVTFDVKGRRVYVYTSSGDVIETTTSDRLDTNGTFEAWTGASLDNWTRQELGGTVTKDTTNQRSGSACVKLDRSIDTVNVVQIYQGETLYPGETYAIEVWAKGSATLLVGLIVQNTTRMLYANLDGVTWDASSRPALSIGTSYQRFYYTFKVRGDFSERDAYNILIRHSTGTTGTQIYIDDYKLYRCRTFSENPIWAATDFLLDKTYGRALPVSRFDFSEAATSAAVCDSLIASSDVQTYITVAAGVATKTHTVASTAGLRIGRTVTIGAVTNVVESIVSDTVFTVVTSQTAASLDAVVQKPPRFSIAYLRERPDSCARILSELLQPANGYVTYANGKVQLKVERAYPANKLLNPSFETWTTGTDAANWAEYKYNVADAFAQDTTPANVRDGLSSMKMTRASGTTDTMYVAQGGLTAVPGGLCYASWWCKTDVDENNDVEVTIYNNTRGVYWRPIDQTWGAYQANFQKSGNAAYAQLTRTARIPATWSPTELLSTAFFVRSATNKNVWVDDVQFYAPIAAEFKETGYAAGYGIIDDSVVWEVGDRKYLTNQVRVKFVNEAGDNGEDEVVANDFDAQAAMGIRSMSFDAPGVSERDQAYRLAKLVLDKIRLQGAPVTFEAELPAIAVQPGDVVLVSHLLPQWVNKLARVIEKRVNAGRMTVTLKCEPYVESLYTDSGPSPLQTPGRTEPTITVTVDNRTAKRVQLSMSLSAAGWTIRNYRIHKSASPGFTPSRDTLCGVTSGTAYSYRALESEVNTTLYFRVIAITDRGTLQASEVSALVCAVDSTSTDPTQQQNSNNANMVYDSDFKLGLFKDGTTVNGDGWLAPNATNTYTLASTVPANPSKVGDAAATNTANAYDGSAGTAGNEGTAATVLSATPTIGSCAWGFGATGAKTGYARVRVATSGKIGTRLYYSTNGTTDWSAAGSTEFAFISGTTGAAYYQTPLLSLSNLNQLVIMVRATPKAGTDDMTASVYSIVFIENSAPYVNWVDDTVELVGGGGVAYAYVRRAFPGKNPGSGVVFAAGQPILTRIWAWRGVGGAAPTADLFVYLEDQVSGVTWPVAQIPAASITTSRQGFVTRYVPGSTVSGTLHLVARTVSTNPVVIDKLEIKQGDVITQYSLSVEDQNAGRMPDWRSGADRAYAAGPWSGVRTSVVS